MTHWMLVRWLLASKAARWLKVQREPLSQSLPEVAAGQSGLAGLVPLGRDGPTSAMFESIQSCRPGLLNASQIVAAAIIGQGHDFLFGPVIAERQDVNLVHQD